MNRFSILILVLFAGLAAVLLFPGAPPVEPEAAPAPPVSEEDPLQAIYEQIPEVPNENLYDGFAWTKEQNDIRLRLLELMRQPIDDPNSSKRHHLIRARQLAVEEMLATLGEEHVDLLVSLMLEEPDYLLRREILLALGRMGSPAAIDALIDHYWRLYMKDQEPELNYAIIALGLAQTPYSFDRLSDMVVHELAEPHRFRFVEQLGRHNDNARAVPLFLEVADSKNEKYFKTRSRAALALKWANDVNAAPKIEALLDTEQDKYVRQALCGTLGDLGDVKSIRKLESVATTDTVVRTRLSAVRALSRIGGARAREILERIQETDADERVRKEAARRLLDM